MSPVVEDGSKWTGKRVLQTLQLMFSLKGYRPPVLPTVAIEVMELSRKPEVEIVDVVSVLERDPMIAGRVLKTAQSPMYASSTPIVSLKQALLRLGLNTMRDLVLEAAVNMRVFRTNGYVDAMDRVREHSTATAYAARHLSIKLSAVPPDQAFLAGLLHDVGIAASLIAIGDVPKQHTPAKLSVIWEVLDEVHGEAGGLMGKSWGLTKEIIEALVEHHRPTASSKPLVSILCLAEAIANDLGYPITKPPAPRGDGMALSVGQEPIIDQQSEASMQRAMARLNLSASKLEELKGEVQAQLEMLPIAS